MGQRPNTLTPHKSPRDHWGSELRALREERGLSLAELGRRVRIDPSYIAKLERGERPISNHLAAGCDAALEAGGMLRRLHALAFSENGQRVVQPTPNELDVASSADDVASSAANLVDNSPSRAASEWSDSIAVPARTADGKVIFVSVSRRALLHGFGTTAAAGLATASVPAPATPPDVSPVQHFEQLRNTLIESDNLFGPARVIPTVHEHVQLIQQLRDSYRGTDARDLLHLQTRFSEFAGWLHQDQGNYQSAQYWLDRSFQWSHATGDPDLAAFILARKAQLAGDMEDGLETVDIGNAAENIARPNSRVAVIAATYAAHGHALRGDSAATQHAYDHARHLLDAVDDPDSPWGPWLDTPYIEVARNRSLAQLGFHEEAAEGFRRILPTLSSGFHRDNGVYLARAAHVHAGARDDEQAAELGMQALAIGNETHSARILTELSQLNDDLARSNSPRVVEFREAVNDTVAYQLAE